MTLLLSKKLIKNVCLFGILFAYFVFGILVSFNSMNLSERLSNKLSIALILIVIMWAISCKSGAKLNIGYYNTLFIFLCLNAILSVLLNGSWKLLGCTCCSLFIFYILPKLKLDVVDHIYRNLFYPYLLACLFAFYLYNVSSFNSQGIIYAFLGVLLLNFLCLKKNPSIIWYLIIVIVMVVVLSITRSRTSMLVFLLSAVISYCYLFVRTLTVKSFFIHIGVASGLFVAYEYLMNLFIKVFFQKWGNADLTSNRINIWKMIFDRASFFGHGGNYLLGSDAHNTFMQILDMFGIIAFIISIVCVVCIFKKIRQATHKIVFYNFFAAWTLASMFEDLNFFTSRMLPVTMLFLLHIALLSNEICIKKAGNNLNYVSNVVLTR